MAIDLKLDSTYDLAIEGGDLALINEGEEVGQKIKIRLLFIEAEWVYDYTLGTPWFDILLSTETSLETKESVIKQTILSVPEVTDVTEFSFGLDPINKGAAVTFTCETIYSTSVQGEVTL